MIICLLSIKLFLNFWDFDFMATYAILFMLLLRLFSKDWLKNELNWSVDLFRKDGWQNSNEFYEILVHNITNDWEKNRVDGSTERNE